MKFSWKPVKSNKYGAKPQVIDGIRFASKLEANYYCKLKLRQKADEVVFFLLQVPFRMDGGSKYLVDFMIFNKDGSIQFVDTKGRDTPISKLKRKEVEAKYGITIDLVTKA